MTESVAAYPCQETHEVYQQRASQIHSTLSALQQEFIDLDGPGKLQAMTKFGADFYIPVKITHACGYLLSGLCSRSQGVRTLEGAAAMMTDEFGVVDTFEELVAKAEQLEPAIEQGVVKQSNAEFMQAEKAIGSSRAVPRPLKVLLDEIQTKHNGVIPVYCRTLRKECKEILKLVEQEFKKRNLEKLNTLRQLYGQKKIDGRLVKLSFDHICNVELGLQYSSEHGGFILKVGGGHLPGTCEALEKIGLVKVINKKQLATGTIDYIIQDICSGKLSTKTELAVTWTEEKLLKAVWEIFDHPIQADVLSTNDKHYIRKGIVDGYEMNIVLDLIDNNQVIYNIIGFLPYC